MDFYKLSNFQLYSIIHSRHLDAAQKEVAERELNRRNLSEDDIQKLDDELEKKTKKTPSLFNVSPNILLFIGAIMFLLLLKQCTTHGSTL